MMYRLYTINRIIQYIAMPNNWTDMITVCYEYRDIIQTPVYRPTLTQSNDNSITPSVLQDKPRDRPLYLFEEKKRKKAVWPARLILLSSCQRIFYLHSTYILF